MFIGAAIYLLYGIFAEPVSEEVENTIVVSAGEIEWMQTAWQKRWNRKSTSYVGFVDKASVASGCLS